MKTIQERNEIWQLSTMRERCALVAKDVIERLQTKQYVATPGHWLSVKKVIEDKESLQTCILGNTECECCALGAALASVISFRNNVFGKDVANDGFKTTINR